MIQSIGFQIEHDFILYIMHVLKTVKVAITNISTSVKLKTKNVFLTNNFKISIQILFVF